MLSCATARPGTTHHRAATTASVDAARRERCMIPPARRVSENGARESSPGATPSNPLPLPPGTDSAPRPAWAPRAAGGLEALGRLDLDLVVPIDAGARRDQ